MKASFVIVNYNRKEELIITISKTKELIKDYSEQYEVVVVDNGSTDGSAGAIRERFPDVVLIAQNVNTGAPAWNLGFEIAKGDFFIIIDDDSHIEYGLNKALEYMEAEPQIGVLALNVITGPYTSKDWNMKEDVNIIGFIGCGAILRKSTYKKVGGYADWIFLYVNEWDLGLRCLNAGYTVQFYESCKVIHRTSSKHRTTKRLTTLVTKHELGIVYKYFSFERNKYLIRLSLNNLKQSMLAGNLKKVWYILIGIKAFLKFIDSLPYTPVSAEVQKKFTRAFHGTKESPFEFIRRRVFGNEKN